jgi:hypothetical protein
VTSAASVLTSGWIVTMAMSANAEPSTCDWHTPEAERLGIRTRLVDLRHMTCGIYTSKLAIACGPKGSSAFDISPIPPPCRT